MTARSTFTASFGLALCCFACSSDPDMATLPGATSFAGASGSAVPPIAGAPAAGSGMQAGAAGLSGLAAAGGGPATPPATGSATAGRAAAPSGGSSGGAAGSNGTTPMGMAGAPADDHDYCVSGEPVDPRDSTFPQGPEQWKASNGAIDLVLPKPVLAWLGERVWEKSHDAWHNVRRCRMGTFPGGLGGGNSICQMTHLIPAHQECQDAEDGYQFLVMHRHMMEQLRRAFPTHTELFEGFPKFPFNASDVPMEWRDRWGMGWAPRIIETANMLEAIEQNLDKFPTEGDLGRFIQCGTMGGMGAPMLGNNIHGALHFKWVVNESPHSLGKQTVNIDNYMFWKLHGWIDKIWERYRVAKGLPPDEPKLVQALEAQCREMHTLGHAVSGMRPPMTPTGPLPTEKGVFHETVRPILEKTCSGCHSESSPEAALALGGRITSAKIVEGLVNVKSMRGGQFMRVMPGNPNQSWFYLKVSGMAASAGCTGAACNVQVMPPAGQVTLSTADLDAIRSWIMNGAPAPTQ